ncbi:thiamine pyrophosphate-dependent enzyme [Tautonia marina]|uniref:thiamine pyrophosphate-dependent enzyme n=1 Tax=Tautonia marina TaxID=2653855 RepID=UPI0012609203|nr:thiamine pyrophosphate-dependent enzyme [Tautonia marina]
MKVAREHYRSVKDLPADEIIAPGSPLCAGCGALTTLRLFHKVLGGNAVVVNAAGCMTLMATYPFTPLRSSWLYTTMASPSAGAQGLRDALDILMESGRLPKDENLNVLVLAGDGSTLDMGLSSTSGAIHRGLDFWYLCYDNEAYGNTGFQASSASPLNSHTATSPLGTPWVKKDIFEIWRSHRPPYVATISAHDAVDLAEKVERARPLRGAKLFVALATCPPGWGFEPAMGDDLAKLAVETGIWPLKEAVEGSIRHTFIPERRRPVEAYLEPQRRYRHLFQPERRPEAIAAIQEAVDRYWDATIASERP